MSINNSQQISDIKTMLVKGMNGEGIESIEKTATEGFIDTYTITYTDGTKTTFDVTNGNWGIWTSAVTAAQGATSVTINNDAIGTTSILEVYSENASGSVVTVNDIDVSAGTAVLTFPALAEATAFILHIINGTASGGGGVATDDYLDLNNKPQINGITLTGNKTTADFGLVNTFLGDLTEWNALSTDEKKMYDHASITGTGGGEYNVNRTTGNLVLTAGVPATYPASQVMLSDDVTSVEDALEANNLDTEVELTSYTTTKYVAPSDGYLRLAATSTSTTNITAYIYGADETKLFALSATYNRINSFNAIFVKKGMKISIILNQNNGNAYFSPLK